MEVRGIWLTNTDSRVLYSRQTIAEAMGFLAETGFNVVFPVVWNKGVTLYRSQVMAQNFGIEIDFYSRGRDPLAEVVEEAHRVGLKVIPWFEYGFASSYQQNGGRIINTKPGWAGINSTGGLVVKNGFEWMNAFDPDVQNFIISLVLEVVRKYDIDGIQGDDRMPAMPSEGGYDPKTVALYRQEFGRQPPVYHKDPQWVQWRANLLTKFLTRLRREVKAIKPNLIISMAPSVYKWGLDEYLQDYIAWIDQDLVDLIHPQLYRRNFWGYKGLVDQLVDVQFRDWQLPKLSPGILAKIGSYRMTSDDLIKAIDYNRFKGVNGEVFFFYEALRENNNELAKTLRKGPYAVPARLR